MFVQIACCFADSLLTVDCSRTLYPGNYREALPIYAESLRIYREVFGEEHAAIAEILLTVASFQNTFMNELQQYIENINIKWSYDVTNFRYSKAQRVAAAQYVIEYVILHGLLDIQRISSDSGYEEHRGPLSDGQLGHIFDDLVQLTKPVQAPALPVAK